MEKAKLINIRRSKKGKLIGDIQFEDGKMMQIPPGTKLDESLNNTECIVDRPNGIIKSITVNKKEIFTEAGSTMSSGMDKKQKYNKTKNTFKKATAKTSTAHAPYNFIPLNDSVVEGQKIPEFDCYHEKYGGSKRFNGYIECKLETLTPLYIRDTYTDKEISRKEEDNKDNPDFFSPGGTVRIPGSSLRGMTRTLVEIMSWGKFGFYDKDRQLFFRAVGDVSSLGKYYRQVMLDEQNEYFPKIKAGVIRKTSNNKYLIYPSKVIKGTQIYRVNFNIKTREVAEAGIYLDEFKFKKVFFKPVEPKAHMHFRINRSKKEKIPYKLKYALVTEVSNHKKEGYVEGVLISSGNLGNKKHMHWIINMPDGEHSISIKKEGEIKLYTQDENRDENVNLLNILEKTGLDGVPCFYIESDSGKIIFGHTGLFRLPYKYTIGDHIPEELKKEELTDMAEAIFGKLSEKYSFASRVFFEDAVLCPGQNNIFLSKEPSVPKILSGPKPTTFQHYLEQDPNSSSRNLNHWNTKGKNIRGYKLYWHRDGVNWRYEGTDQDKRKNQKLLTQIKPIKPGTKFTFRIRFENLTKEELGAMLFALELPRGCCHKLGMGKPLGLGSIKINPVLFMINRKRRYTQLFDGDNWRLGEKQVEIQQFKDAFEKYVLSNINTNNNCYFSLWEDDRMKQLKTMLNWNNTKIGDWTKETKYMTIEPYNEFKNRPILPRPTEVYDKLTKKH